MLQAPKDGEEGTWGAPMEAAPGFCRETVVNTRNKVQGRLLATGAGSAGHARAAAQQCELAAAAQPTLRAGEPHHQAGKITFPAILNYARAIGTAVKSLIPLIHQKQPRNGLFFSLNTQVVQSCLIPPLKQQDPDTAISFRKRKMKSS